MNKLSKLLIAAIAVLQLCLPSIELKSQTSANAINYQAVVRNSAGIIEPDQSIAVLFTILAGDVNGAVVWQEEHSTQTNRFGLFTLNIGKGSRKEGVAQFSDINWGANKHFLKVEVKIGDNKDFAFYGTTQMLAVPYALYAEKAGTATPDFTKFTFDVNANTLKNDGVAIADLSPLRQDLQYDPISYHLSITGKPGIVDLRQFAHTPQDLRILNHKLWVTGNKDSTVVDLSPYKQTLSVSAVSKLQISGGNEVQVDTSNVNEIQTLSLNGNKVILSRSGGEVTIDASETNELQTLSKVNNALVLSNAPNGRAIPIDTSLNNEIQTIQRTGNKLSLSGTALEVSVDDADADAGNELIGNINYNQNTKLLTIQEGANTKTADLSPKKVAFRAIKTTNTPFASGASSIVLFTDEKLDISNSYDAITGIFTVPENGAGIYCFFFTVESVASEFTYELLKNNQNPEILLPFNQPILLELQENDNIKIRATSSDVATLKKASFIGYKLN